MGKHDLAGMRDERDAERKGRKAAEGERDRLLKVAKKVLAATSPTSSYKPASTVVAKLYLVDAALAELRKAVEEVERGL